MKDATLPLHAAIVSAIDTALTGGAYSGIYVGPNPDDSDTLPYIQFGGSTGVPFATKSTEGMEVTYTLTAWAATFTASNTLADLALRAVTDRTAPLTVTGFGVAFAELDFREMTIRIEEPPNTYWGTPIRVRFRMVET